MMLYSRRCLYFRFSFLPNLVFRLIRICTVIMFSLLVGIVSSNLIAGRVEALQDQSYGWTYNIGGAGSDPAMTVEFDTNGNIIHGGSFSTNPLDFDPTAGTDMHSVIVGGRDCVVSKLGGDGSYYWTRTWGCTTGDCNVWNVNTDSANNVYIAGAFWTDDVDFDGTSGVDIHSGSGGYDVSLVKYDMNGSYVWTVTFGGTAWDQAWDAVVDSDSDVILSGHFESLNVDFDPSGNTALHSSAGSTDIFVVKYDSDGDYLWSHSLGGTSGDKGYSIKVDNNDNVYLVGYFSGTNIDFDPSAGTELRSSNGGTDAFITKYDSNGNFQWVKTWGSTEDDRAYGLSIFDNKYLYVTGRFSGTNVDFDPGSSQDLHSSNGSADIFVSRYSTGGDYGWTETIGGTGSEIAFRSEPDKFGNVFMSGRYIHNGYTKIVLSKIFANGSEAWSYIIGADNGSTYSHDVSARANGEIAIAGWFASTNVDFDITTGTDIHSNPYVPSENIFVSKYIRTTTGSE